MKGRNWIALTGTALALTAALASPAALATDWGRQERSFHDQQRHEWRHDRHDHWRHRHYWRRFDHDYWRHRHYWRHDGYRYYNRGYGNPYYY